MPTTFTHCLYVDAYPTDHRKVVLGTKPILLSAFSSGGQRHVFAASDRPTIIYSNNKKLLYSNLNENEVSPWCVWGIRLCV